jgi:transcriptional regulator with XRE-family HTH domain
MRNEPTGTEDTFERRLGQRVRRAREAAGLTQSRLERDAGLPGATVARLERGEYDLPVSELADIARVLRTDPGNLVPPIGDPDAGDRQ